MGQEQSYMTHASIATTRRPKDNQNHYEDPIQYRSPSDYDKDYKRNKLRRSGDSFKSDNTDSSGYRSGSQSCSERSSKSDYYCTSLYKNDHYKEVNKEIYKPVKISKEKRYKLQLFDDNGDLKNERMKSYLSDTEKAQKPTQKKAGIRNYTPKILEDEKRGDNWI